MIINRRFDQKYKYIRNAFIFDDSIENGMKNHCRLNLLFELYKKNEFFDLDLFLLFKFVRSKNNVEFSIVSTNLAIL